MTDRLHALVDGESDAPVLVLGSSLGTTSSLWQPLLPALVERFRVVRYDHLGHGASEVPRGPYSIERLGRAVLDLLDRLEIRSFSYAGLSLGGMVGMWLAAHAPERVDKLALMCTAAQLPPKLWLDRAAIVRTEGIASIAGQVVLRWFADPRPDVVASFRRGLAATPDEGYASCCEAIAAMDLRPGLARIVAPTLVIGGAVDVATPLEYQQAIVDAVPCKRFAVVASGHLAPVERPDEVARLLLEHLREDGPRG